MNEQELRDFISKITFEGKPLSNIASIDGIQKEEDAIILSLHFKPIERKTRHAAEAQVKQALKSTGIEDVIIDTLADDMPQPGDAPAAQAPKSEPEPKRSGLENVKQIIAVASGKGGVGKSTIALNLALALAAKGKRVGVCDLDIYGPSLPTQLGIADHRLKAKNANEIEPLEASGLKVMSLGFLVDAETPVIWRGPMVAGMVTQFTNDIQWGELDFLILDMPPGTGDIQLTLTQTVPLSGAIIVTTPGRLALIDAIKGLQMFRKVDVPVLGFVENMSFYICPKCGHQSEPFNGGGTAEVAARLETPLLAQIPLDDAVQRGGDEGKPIVLSAPNSPQSQAFLKLAETLIG